MEKKKILMVDDEPSLTRMVKMNLEATGKYAVEVENHPENALTRLQERRPDLILMDIIMPKMEGSEVARKIRSVPEFKDIPIIFLTAAVTYEEVSSAGGTIGGETFLAKPISIKQLVDNIEHRLNR